MYLAALHGTPLPRCVLWIQTRCVEGVAIIEVKSYHVMGWLSHLPSGRSGVSVAHRNYFSRSAYISFGGQCCTYIGVVAC